MKHDRSNPLRTLAHRYVQAEDTRWGDLFMAAVFGALGLATGGVVLLAFVQTPAMVLLAFVLAVAAALAVLATMTAMLSGEGDAAASSDPSTTSERRPRQA